MAQQRQVSLQEAQERELTWARTHHVKAYVRERAAAILKVAAGHSMRQVAAHGLLQPRTQEAVSEWIDRYLAEGLTGLLVRKGRGRKPAFSPCARPARS
jgi:transposase